MGQLRGINCYYTKNLAEDPNNHIRACWSGIGREAGTVIKIGKFDEYFTDNHIEALVELINKITPCSLKEDNNGVRCIYYTTIGKYPKDLYLLNFVRYLWNANYKFDSLKFFKTLSRENDLIKGFIDPLEILSFSAMIAMKSGIHYSGDHSGLYTNPKYKTKPRLVNNTAVRNIEDFKKWNGKTTMESFATGTENKVLTF